MIFSYDNYDKVSNKNNFKEKIASDNYNVPLSLSLSPSLLCDFTLLNREVSFGNTFTKQSRVFFNIS